MNLAKLLVFFRNLPIGTGACDPGKNTGGTANLVKYLKTGSSNRLGAGRVRNNLHGGQSE